MGARSGRKQVIQVATCEHHPDLNALVADAFATPAESIPTFQTGGYVDAVPARLQDPRTSYMTPAMYEMVKAACRK